jgi:predicted  nucleic acid-binding Zn-ribbon protein
LTLLNDENNQLREMRRKFELAQQRVMDLECENARLVEEFMHTNNDKEAKIKDIQQINSQLKNEIRTSNVRIKDMECELTRIKNEVEVERSKRHEAEAAIKNENLLKQAYDRISGNLKTQKGHIDELQRSN